MSGGLRILLRLALGATLILHCRASLAAPFPTAPQSAAMGSFPERAAALDAQATAFLAGKNFDGALSAAKEALSSAALWKREAEKRASWDGTGEGADRSWKSLAALFPYDEDAGKFLAAGRRFLSAAALHEGIRGIEEENGVIVRRVDAGKEGISLRKRAVAEGIRRAEEIRNAAQAGRRKAEGMRDRLRIAARTLPLSGWGAKMDPRRAFLIGKADGKFREIRERVERIRAVADATDAGDYRQPLPPEDRRMLFYAQRRLAGVEDGLSAMEGRAAFLKMAIRNAWKAEYAARLSVQLERSEIAAESMSLTASKAQAAIRPLADAVAELTRWEILMDTFRKRLGEGSSTLAKRKADTKEAAGRELSGAGRELLSAIGRNENRARYLAARAATEGRMEDGRPDLLAEAIRHWEALLPSPGERCDVCDEALYALAELRYEEEESRFLRKEDPSGESPDFSAPVSLFRRVLEEYPESPYAEQAAYGLALSLQESGAADNAVAVMEALLARHPGTRFADELRLRLGEYAFDEYEFAKAEESYRKVSAAAPPEIRATALFKAGWSIFLQGRPAEAVEPFLSALLLSPAAKRTGGLPAESLAMTARALVEANMDSEAETLLARRGGSAHGPALLLRIQDLLAAQNRYPEAAEAADRMGRHYPAAAERIEAESAAAETLRKAGREKESNARKAKFHLLFGPGSAWRAFPGRTPEEVSRADAAAEEAVRSAAFHFHAQSRLSPPGDRGTVLALYDAALSLFPASPKAEEIAYQRAWLLFEDGKKREAAAAFEAVALRPGGTRGEACRYMAIQCAKDLSSPADAPSQEEVVRLCREYERAFPLGERLRLALMDLARAHANLRRPALAAEAAEKAAALARTPAELRAALRLQGDARFEMEDFAGAERSFRAFLAADPPPEEASAAAKWIGFSLFRRAEKLPRERSAEAAEIFAGAAREFPSLEIAPVAAFRAGEAYADAGKHKEALAAFLSIESLESDPALSLDATRRLARLYEKTGDPLAAGERHERLAAAGGEPPGDRTRNLLRAAELFSLGKDEARARKNLEAVASLPGVPPELRIQCLFRAGESARAEGKPGEADRYYGETVAAHEAAPDAAPAVAGHALFRRAEHRFLGYRELSISPPLEKTFPAKQAALEESAKLYLEAIRRGDAATVSASLHRLGEAFEDFRTAILTSPPPKGLSDAEREEYAFLLEEKAAPIEEKAVESYSGNLRQAVAGDYGNEWVEKSLQRLKILRPARYGKKGEWAFPVPTVPAETGAQARNLAAFPEFRKGNLAGAEAILARNPEEADLFPEILANAGLVRMERGKWKEARERLEKAVAKKPEMPQGWINLGIFREIYEGKTAEALECYRRYVKSGGQRKDEVDRWIEWLEKSPPRR